jgi:hypothetical protein
MSKRRRQCLRLVRRAFLIPDLVTDEHARQAVVLDLYDQLSVEPGAEHEHKRHACAERVFDQFLDVVERGGLDRFLVRIDNTFDDWEAESHAALWQELNTAVGYEGPRGILPQPAVNRIVDVVMRYARKYPYFEDYGKLPLLPSS